MTLVATPGDPLANSYCTAQQATAYLDERLHTEPWYAQNPGDQVTLNAKREAALITATRLLDEQFQWVGMPSTAVQVLGWPRAGLSYTTWQTLDPLLVPAQVQRATAYYALALLRDTSEASPTTTTVESGTIKRQTLGETTIEYFQPGSTTTSQTTQRPPQTHMPAEIRQMLRGYGVVLGGVMVPLLRV